MIQHERGIAASGHKLVSEAAAAILREGGNAFDAAAAAGFASTVVEPALTSLGGGGLLLGHSAKHGQNLFFDFFVDTPGLGREKPVSDPHFFPVTVEFSGALQVFNVGLGSVAVPGVAKGLLHIHERLGRMDLHEIIAPAVDLAKGYKLSHVQSNFLGLLHPIMTLTATGRELYGKDDEYVKQGDLIVNDELAAFLESVADDRGESLYRGDIGRAIVTDMQERNGLLTEKDLAEYRVIERKPIKISYRDAEFFTSPSPSMGGSLIGLSLSLSAAGEKPQYKWGGEKYLLKTLATMQEVERLRKKGITTPEALSAFLEGGIPKSLENIRLCTRGTTHISISDREGNCASMTCSNGEGSGYYAPGTGIMLNNMMGEDDLHPDGFHTSPAGQRVGSMMSPSLLVRNNRVELVIGSGGSKRIRTAISQVLNQVVDYGRPLAQAVAAPRLYWDGDCLQAEPGFDKDLLARMNVNVNIWDDMDVYFGGVHAVIPGKEGAGDPRRGGSVVIV
jgi:gamma-glutamyltranspeptidase/glutathione hydrolase